MSKPKEFYPTLNLFAQMVRIAEKLPESAGRDAIIHCCNFYLWLYYKKVMSNQNSSEATA